MSVKRKGEKSLLSRQEIASRRKALSQKKMQRHGTGRRAIAGVLILAASVLALLSVATFDAHDRIGPGFRNAIGPVGHAIAEMLRGALGLCAFVLPSVGLYTAGILFLGDRTRRRWPQAFALGLLVVAASILFQMMFTEDKSWAHAPGGVIGRELSGIMTALFSTVGTVVLTSALAAVAFIVGTEFTFLKLCGWLWSKAVIAFHAIQKWTAAFIAKQQENLMERRLAAQKAKEEEAAFLAQLEEEEAELNELEASVEEAEAMAQESERQVQEKENARLADLAEKERLKAEREKALVEREAARLAKEALKTARTNQKEQRKEAAAALAPQLLSEAAPRLANGDPAWVSTLHTADVQPPLPPAENVNPPQRRVPNIVESASASAITQPPAPAEAPAPAAPPATSALAHVPVIVEPKAPPKPTKKEPKEEFLFSAGRETFDVPPLELLEVHRKERAAIDKEAYLETAERLTAKLKDFGIDGEVVEIRPGPVVTMYEFRPAPGVKISRIASLADDLAMAMEAMRVRIVAPIPGKGVVGVEVPNKDREMVFLKEIAEQDAFQKSQSRLTMCLGKDIEGMPYILDLAKAPHLLMAGTTGSGKSVSVNAMIMSILLKSTPEEVRFIMVDPKMLELSVYEGIPHLLLPVVTDPRKAAIALQWAVDEMTRRYKLLSEAGVRNITGYNQHVEQETAKRRSAIKPTAAVKSASTAAALTVDAVEEREDMQAPATDVKKKRRMLILDVDASPPSSAAAQLDATDLGVAKPGEPLEDIREHVSHAAVEASLADEIRVDEQTVAALRLAAEASDGAAAPVEAPEELKKLPYIVVIIDELADLMMVASKEVETSIARLAQMARAAGIHLMVATQRPSTDVVTGIIKANFPTRISFMLRSKPDSMTILGTVGAEALLGMGDMLIMPPTSAHLQRVHGCFVSEHEIKKVVDHLKAQGQPVYDDSILKPREDEGQGEEGFEDDLSDELYDQAIAIVSEMRQVSISMLQRKMRIGYNRSARMIERMEREGIVGPADGAKPREVLVRPIGQMAGTGAM